MTFLLGLTGSMATGKSTVLQMFADEGAPVYSADKAVHEIYEGPLPDELAALVPDAVINGTIDRRLLSAALAAHPEKLAPLEAIVHPLVREKSQAFIDRAQRDGADLAVLEIPLLFETANRYRLDAVAVCWVTAEIQRTRALARPGMNVEKLEALLARQVPQADKKRRANFLIDTGTSLEQTRDQVRAIARACRAGEIPQPDGTA